MKHSVPQVALGALSLAIFPASWVLVSYMMQHKEWCFADFCVETQSARQPLVRNTLGVYYSFIATTAILVAAAKKFPLFKHLFGTRVQRCYTYTIGELAWFISALLLSLIVVPATVWNSYWSMLRSAVPAWSWIRLVYQTMILATGDSLAFLLGLVMLPASKNSFFATLLDLPYTSTLRVHIWLGYAIFWAIAFHLVFCIIGYSLDATPLYEKFFTVAADMPWGKSKYFFLMGMISFFLFAIITATSVAYVRRRHYNFFYVTHFLFVAAIAFAYFHASMSIFYMIPGICLYTIDGFIRLHSYRSKEHITNVVFEESGYVSITIATTKCGSTLPGQFMRVNVPSVSTFEFHPLSIVQATPDSVSFLFRPNGKETEWTCLLASKLASTPNLAVHLQGPFGKPIGIAYDTLQQVLVFHVAGTGLSSCIAAIELVLERNALLENIVPVKIFLFWSSRNMGMENLSWIQGHLKGLKNITVELFQTSDDPGDIAPTSITTTRVIHHRPNLRQLLKKHVSALVSDCGGVLNAGVFVCGPETFVRDALESVASYASLQKGVKLAVEVESYDL
ncbi:hypothetical protein BDR26DRAFT_914075 [Obelidium mucronatum]|nr:hypothetical protein BDR26DRAFT_914075 [Obelidium mucronatum]